MKYCTYCKEKIENGKDYVVSEDNFYHVSCYLEAEGYDITPSEDYGDVDLPANDDEE